MPAPITDSAPRQVGLHDLARMNLNGDITLPVEVAKSRYDTISRGSLYPADETFYGHGFTGTEHLAAEVRIVHLDDTDAPPLLHVERRWTLDDLYEVCRLACAYGLHEMTGGEPALGPILKGLASYGLKYAVPRCPPEMQAAYLAAGGDTGPDGLGSYKHQCSYIHWEGTAFSFDGDTGTLTIRTRRGP